MLINDQPDAAAPATATTTPGSSPWRCLVFLLISIPLVVVAYQGLPIPIAVPGLPGVVAVMLLIFSSVLLKREGRSLAELGLSWSLGTAGKLACGFAGGVLLFAFAALLLRAVLPFYWERSPDIVPLAVMAALLYHLATNACEELAFRGYAFDNLIRRFGLWPAQLLIAILFAMFHIVSGWPWEVAFISTTAGSLLFGLVFVRWRSVPAAIGVHAAWNWSRDLILGMPPGGAALWSPAGAERWTPAQWSMAQLLLVGVTLAACAVIRLSMSRAAQHS